MVAGKMNQSVFLLNVVHNVESVLDALAEQFDIARRDGVLYFKTRMRTLLEPFRKSSPPSEPSCFQLFRRIATETFYMSRNTAGSSTLRTRINTTVRDHERIDSSYQNW